MHRPVRSVRIPAPVAPVAVPLSPAEHPNTDNKVRPILPRATSASALALALPLPASPVLPPRDRDRASSATRPSIKFTFKAMEHDHHEPPTSDSADAAWDAQDDEYPLAGAMDVDPVLDELARWESDDAPTRSTSTPTSHDLATRSTSSAIHVDSLPTQTQSLGVELIPAQAALTPSLVVADPVQLQPGHLNATSTEADPHARDEVEWQDPAVRMPVPHTRASPPLASHAESAAIPLALAREPTPPALLKPTLDDAQHTPLVAPPAADVVSAFSALDSPAILAPVAPSDLPNPSSNRTNAEPVVLPAVEPAADEPTRLRSASAHAEPPSPSHSASTTTIDSSPLIITSLNLALPPPLSLSPPNPPMSEQEPTSERSGRSPSPPLVVERAPSRQQRITESLFQPRAAASPDPNAGLDANTAPVALACTDSPPPMSAAEGDVLMDISELDLPTSSAEGLSAPFAAESSTIQPEQPSTGGVAESAAELSPRALPFSFSTLLNGDSPPPSVPPPPVANGHSHAPDQPRTNGSHPAPAAEPAAKPPLAFVPAQSRSKVAINSSSFSAPHMPTPAAAAAPKSAAPPRAAPSLDAAPSLAIDHKVSHPKVSLRSTEPPPLAPVPHYGLVLPRERPAPSADGQRSLPLIYVAEHLPCSFMRTGVLDDIEAVPVSDYAYHATADEYALSLAEQRRKGKGRAVDLAGGYAGRPWSAYGFGPLPKKPPPVEGEREDSPPLMPAVLDKRKKEYRDMMLAKKAHEAKMAASAAAPKGTPVPKDKVVEKEVQKPPKAPAVRVKIPTRFKKAISASFFPDRTNHASSSTATFGPRKPGSLASHPAFQNLLARPPTYLDPSGPLVGPPTTKVIAPPPHIPIIPTLPPVPAYKPVATRRPSSTDYTSDDDDDEYDDDDDDEGSTPRSAPLKRRRASGGGGGRASALSHEFVDTSSEDDAEIGERFPKRSRLDEEPVRS